MVGTDSEEVYMKLTSLTLLLILSVACSSRSLQRDYVVVDSSHQDIPEWVEDLDEWIDDEQDDKKKSRYYVYTSDPKNDRTISCELAEARAGSKVAGEVSQFIKQTIASSIEGDPKSKKKALEQYIEEDLVKEVQAKLVGVKVLKTYWEKRRFQKDLGAKKNKDAYTCTKLLKISKKNLKRLFKMSYAKMEKKATNAELKAKVKASMEKAEKAYTE
jgi:hypothetical protein